MATRNGVDGPIAYVKRSAPKPSPVFNTYWNFAAERQAILMRRLEGRPGPWTGDKILSIYKFTNAYRASDRTSQYLIRRVIYDSTFAPEDTFFRIVLFKIFNKAETWELLNTSVGPITLTGFDAKSYDRLLTNASRSTPIYSAAYIMPTGSAEFREQRKHRMHLRLLERMHREKLFASLTHAKSLEQIYLLLRQYPGIGPFLGFQYAIDLNYSDFFRFSEMDFVVPGPGALDGLRKCFHDLGDYSEMEVIRWVADRQEVEFANRDLQFERLAERRLQLVDCQNLFCEVDKYARVAHPEFLGNSGRARIKQKFLSVGPLAEPFYPPFWGVNEWLAKRSKRVQYGQNQLF